MKLIYIRTSYDSGITLPMSALSLLGELQIVKNEGYLDFKGLKIHPDFNPIFQVIDSSEIGKETRLAQAILEAQEDLATNQRHLDHLESQK